MAKRVAATKKAGKAGRAGKAGTARKAGAAGKAGKAGKATKAARTAPKTSAPRKKSRAAAKAPRFTALSAKALANELFGPLPGSEPRMVGGVQLDVVRAGAARVKREIYPVGFRWSTHMRPVSGTDLCMHAHVGFLAHGQIHIEYADGCVVEHRAPQVVSIEPGHEGWVVGSEPAVLIEFDFERDTIEKLGMPAAHRHD